MNKNLNYFVLMGIHGLRYYNPIIFLWFHHHAHLLDLNFAGAK